MPGPPQPFLPSRRRHSFFDPPVPGRLVRPTSSCPPDCGCPSLPHSAPSTPPLSSCLMSPSRWIPLVLPVALLCTLRFPPLPLPLCCAFPPSCRWFPLVFLPCLPSLGLVRSPPLPPSWRSFLPPFPLLRVPHQSGPALQASTSPAPPSHLLSYIPIFSCV